ncbi:MAG: LacI family DNA-binding transcriptional regulator [Spirochaetaceae bacterium]|nr:MAG: LacI family DNA-binding transcriptional regulator [Spirochaetaceae bacterium]
MTKVVGQIAEVHNIAAVTIKDIAREANVSYATVSRALNNKRGVREATRQKVLKLATEMSYTPNAIARGLVKKQTHTLGLIIPDITNPFYPEVARGIEDGAAEEGFSIFLCNTNWERERELEYLKLLAEKRADGIILAPIDNEVETAESRLTGKMPIVYVSNAPVGTLHSFVVIDNVLGGFLATEHLIRSGYRKIGFVGSTEDSLTIAERLKGYRKALEKYGITIDERHIQLGEFKQESGYRIMRKMISDGDYPRAIFAENDLLALGILQGVKAGGLSVPEDVAVVGFDDIPFASFPGVQLTTINQPTYEMGRKAVNILLGQIQGSDGNLAAQSQQIYLKPRLIVRQSSGPSIRVSNH